jgi:hypothetical protein
LAFAAQREAEMKIKVIGVWPYSSTHMRAELVIHSAESINTKETSAPEISTPRFELRAYVLIRANGKEPLEELSELAKTEFLDWMRYHMPPPARDSDELMRHLRKLGVSTDAIVWQGKPKES